jgi:adenylyltransferase/sulfurtransferase
VLGVLCGAIGSVMANEALKLITGIGRPLLGRLLTFDALTTRWREVPVHPDPHRAPIGDLADIAIQCAVPAPAPVPAAFSISAATLAAKLVERDRGTNQFDLLDVREQQEFDQVAIPGARLVPRRAFLDGSAFASLDRALPLVLYCHSGARSAEVLNLAREAGFDAVHLAGGILAWINAGDGDVVRA